MHILVLTGGISHERDVSLRSGRRVADALVRAGHQVDLVDADPTFLARLRAVAPDVVFPALHGASGEDGTLYGLLDAMGVRYVGSDALAARLAWNKPLARDRVSKAGIPVAPGRTVTRESVRELGASAVMAALESALGLPVVVKPAQGGSAQGVSIVRETEGLGRALIEAFSYADAALVEQFIPGREIAVTVIERAGVAYALPPVEIEPIEGLYDFAARYTAGSTRFYAPARLDESALAQARDLALAAHRALGLGHFSRIDLIVTETGSWCFLEANVVPGMTETSLLPLAVAAAGLTAEVVYGDLVSEAARAAT